ncbi:MAG: glycosyltransferase family 2 protein, partial [Oscillospiraceae bacterium]|nr:glycosyltransferase family 2 protein [Oscillospiraceae bacterium]
MISIVVPVYKSEKTLHRCVDSLLRQTFGDIEVLLVVDGSPDRSAEICEEYAAKDARVRVLYRHNEGVSQARNRGVEHASGEYICFVDSDDFIEASTCERMLGIMEEEQADLVIAGFHHWYLGRDVKKRPRAEKTYTK